jgi:3-oxoadipate enol-lactonase
MPTVAISPTHHLHYLETNSEGADPVVLLHGLGVNGASWELQFPALTQGGFRTLAPDMRGFGHSSYPGEASVQAMAEDVATFIRTLASSRAHVVGISMGGAVALQLAVDAPACIERLVLVNTFAELRPKTLSSWLYFVQRMVLIHTLGLGVQAELVARRIFPYPHQTAERDAYREQVRLANPKAYRATMRGFLRYSVMGQLANIPHKTLVVTSIDDTTVPPINQSVIAERIPHARQVEIPASGHAVSVDSPDVFNAVLLGFLTEPDERAPTA